MLIVIKAILIMGLLTIFYQDLKHREVSWFLFPLVGILVGLLHYQKSTTTVFITFSLINLAFIGVLIGVVFLYSKLKLQQSLAKTFGLGDGFLFIALAFSFPSINFSVLLVFGLLCALLLHLVLKQKSQHTTVPLAGHLSLFFAIVYLSYWLGIIDTLYIV